MPGRLCIVHYHRLLNTFQRDIDALKINFEASILHFPKHQNLKIEHFHRAEANKALPRSTEKCADTIDT